MLCHVSHELQGETPTALFPLAETKVVDCTCAGSFLWNALDAIIRIQGQRQGQKAWCLY